jgi:hypothetical protein
MKSGTCPGFDIVPFACFLRPDTCHFSGVHRENRPNGYPYLDFAGRYCSTFESSVSERLGK